MRSMLLLSLSFLFCGVAVAEPVRDALAFGSEIVSTRSPKRDVNGAFSGIMDAAGVGVSSGKIMLLRRSATGQREAVAVMVGTARLMPLFDVNLGGASALIRFAF